MTATLRKARQRERLAQTAGRRIDLYLSNTEAQALEAYRIRKGLPNMAEAVRSLIDGVTL